MPAPTHSVASLETLSLYIESIQTSLVTLFQKLTNLATFFLEIGPKSTYQYFNLQQAVGAGLSPVQT